jgi:hypothetical protein
VGVRRDRVHHEINNNFFLANCLNQFEGGGNGSLEDADTRPCSLRTGGLSHLRFRANVQVYQIRAEEAHLALWLFVGSNPLVPTRASQYVDYSVTQSTNAYYRSDPAKADAFDHYHYAIFNWSALSAEQWADIEANAQNYTYSRQLVDPFFDELFTPGRSLYFSAAVDVTREVSISSLCGFSLFCFHS